jgi:tetraacyldisaccharide 4'-kinase
LSAARWLDGPLGLLLAPLGWLYAGISRLRLLAYRRGWRRSFRPPMPTLSIGNLSTGGTGKTPLLFHALAWFEECQLTPGVLSRGYGGDEGRMLEERHPSALLAEDPDRVRALQQFLSTGPPEVLVLDDGFQHLRLQRDLDVVLLDATRPFGRCLPAGLFREPARALRRADLVVLTRADLVDAAAREAVWRRVDAVRGGAPLPRLEGTVRARELRHLRSGRVEAAEWLRGRRAHLSAGVGNPASFRALCEGLGVEVASTSWMPDHHAWNEEDLRGWESHELVLVTEKDGVKLHDIAPEPVWELRVDWVFTRGEEAWRRALEDFALRARAARFEPMFAACEPEGGALR